MSVFRYIPFSFLWIFRKAIGDDVGTILDLGCGNGQFMATLALGENWNITGVDIYKSSIKIAKRRNIYKRLICGDVLGKTRQFYKRGEKFDVVFCSQVLEHMPKPRGEELLKLSDKLARKRSVFSTPRGFMPQPEEFLDDNPYQAHKSGWDKNDFRKRGYVTRGLGFKLAWSYSGLARNKNRLIGWLFTFLSFVFSPLVYYFPKLGSGILAIKIYEK